MSSWSSSAGSAAFACAQCEQEQGEGLHLGSVFSPLQSSGLPSPETLQSHSVLFSQGSGKLKQPFLFYREAQHC